MAERLLPSVLRYVDQVARCGSIQGAAKDLNIAASAIDRQILLLEAKLGIAIFERMPRGMRPTVAGDRVIAISRRWRSELRRLGAEIRDLEGINQGHVRLVAMDSHANGILPPVVERLRADHPKISLEIEIMNTDSATAALVNGEADVGLVFNLPPHRELRVIWSRELPLGCIVAPSHPLAAEKSVTLQKVATVPLVLQARSLVIRRYLENHHSWIFQQGHPPVVTNSLQLVKMLVRSGQYAALTSQIDAAPELLNESLVFIPVKDKAAEPQTISLAASARLPSPKIAQIVADYLQQEATGILAQLDP